MSEEKKYSGYGYHGGGRPKKEGAKTKTISISGSDSEIAELKRLASESGKSVSRFILDSLIK